MERERIHTRSILPSAEFNELLDVGEFGRHCENAIDVMESNNGFAVVVVIHSTLWDLCSAVSLKKLLLWLLLLRKSHAA